MDTPTSRQEIIHKLTSYTASFAMLWEVFYEAGHPITLDADKAEMMHETIQEMRALLASFPSAK